MTTAIAIYGAVLATTSTLLGVWYFLYSGPRLQAEANVLPAADADGHPIDDDWSIVFRVWNTGRAEVTVNITSILIHHDERTTGLLVGNGDWEGPDVPARIQGHSAESWWIEKFDLQYIVREPFKCAKLSIALEVGGKREIEVPVSDGWHRRNKRPFILQPAHETT